MICWLQDFFKNWSVAVEALATVALVIAAVFQWAAMRAQARQERERWKREDELRAEENKPKAVFRLKVNAHKDAGTLATRLCLELRCANIGTVGFLVTGIRRIEQNENQTSRIITPITLSQKHQFVVPVGTEQQVVFDVVEYFGYDYCADAEVSLSLQGPLGETVTDARAYLFRLSVDKHKRDVYIHCPKCKNANPWVITVDYLTLMDEYKKEYENKENELRKECPNHERIAE
jgi:hypothetical protein